MMASIGGQTGSLLLIRFLLGVFLFSPEGAMSLELLPSSAKVVLTSGTNYTVVCSGWSRVSWRLPQDPPVDGVLVDNQGSSSILQLFNITWRNSGRYTCEEESANQNRDLSVFIPGQGPDEWFVPMGPGLVMKETEEATVPCVVSDPELHVLLYERPTKTLVRDLLYDPAHGFTGHLNDTSYMCLAARGAEERESQVFYVYNIIVPKEIKVDLTASSRILKQGEVLTVNCTVKDTEMVFFSWDFPRRQEIEPLTDFLPSRIRSFINITTATMADSGVYVCAVQETTQGRTVEKNITITVLDRGYVDLWPSHETNVSSLLHQTVEFSVEINAHPPPTILWTQDNQNVTMETTSITTTHLSDSRYLTTLTLVRVQMAQTGSYMATVSNADDIAEVTFNLEVKAPPRITSLSEVSSTGVLCIGEGAPPPSVTWYTCSSSHRCTNQNGGWMNQSEASEGMTVQENVTMMMERGISQVRSVLTVTSLSSLSAVRCEVSNSAGRRARDLRVFSNSLLSQVVILVVVLVLVIIAVIFLVILIVLWRKKPRYEVRWRVIESVSPDGQKYTYLDPAHLPYSSAWEVSRDNVVLGKVLGSGAFGRVVEATISGLFHSHSMTKVAVKMVKPGSDAVQSLMSELKVLVHLGPHLNIVNLLGACTRGGPVYLITEFCRHGDLVVYLQRNKHTFLHTEAQSRSDSDGGYMDMNKEDGSNYVAMKELSYADIEPAVYEAPDTPTDHQETPSLLLSDSSLLRLPDLISFSYQVAQAMDFLSSRKCVHRDLAARNVLVCDGKLVKVCDFGLARDLQKDQDYIARGNSFLPLKWMSPESVFQNIYSCQSDIWSYGVLLWEIFSLGSSPYPDLPLTQDIYTALRRGHRMSRPEHAPQNMYELMMLCWDQQPQSRPSFSSLVVSVGNMLTDDFRQRYQRLTDDFLKGASSAVLRPTSSSRCDNGSPAPLDQTDPTPFTEVIIETNSSTALDAVSRLLSDSLTDTQEVTSSSEQKHEEISSSSEQKQEATSSLEQKQEVEEESCL
ncbi:platelet-derived growth factor receptor beta-like isoform 2-T4 [Pholidichthys leucotaenia]